MTNVGTDRSQLSPVAKAAKATLEVDKLDAVADRGYFSGEEILACENAGIMVTLPKPMTSIARQAQSQATYLKGGRALRQAGFPLRGGARHLHLSRW